MTFIVFARTLTDVGCGECIVGRCSSEEGKRVITAEDRVSIRSGRTEVF